MISQDIYKLRPAEVFQRLGTSTQGLSWGEAAARQAQYGKNVLAEEMQRAPWKRFAVHALHPFALLLWLSGSVAWLARQPVLGGVMWSLVAFNAALSYWREHRAEQAMLALRNLLPAYARTMRDGQEQNLPASEIVPGDLLVMAEGDYVAADARLVEAYGLRVSNATLTGEATSASKTPDASFRETIGELERPNLVFAGTTVTAGTGKAVAYTTGMSTQFGRIAHLTQTVRDEPSLIQQELAQITRRIAVIALGVAILVFVAGITEVGLPPLEAFLLALGILAAAIPEGLPANLTLTLAMSAQRLAQKSVLVKKLSVIETLGTVSMVCTDKSGTLTRNQMTVRKIWVGGRQMEVSGTGYEPTGLIWPTRVGGLGANGAHAAGDLRMLLTAASLCNNARLCPPTEQKPGWSSLGDQTEAALRVVARKGGLDETALESEYPRVHELPFDARRKRMSTIHRVLNGSHANAGRSLRAGEEQYYVYPAHGQKQEIIFVKGAPREVLEACTHVRIDGQVLPLEASHRLAILSAFDEYARKALRVLAFAYRALQAPEGAYTPDKVEQELTFLGLMAMYDPPRPEVSEALQRCKQAGIRIVMITGDYGLTALSMAQRVGILEEAPSPASPPRIVTGAEVESMHEDELHDLLDGEVLFARMAPEHKLRLVAAFQQRGEVVAMTGDGVNDAPALRKADIGVAMGMSGVEVARQAADIILADDNFAHLADAIAEGRSVYENLRKFIVYIFSSNVPEIFPFILTALTNLPLALTVRQILAIDLGTDLLPGLALGAEKPEPDIMQRPPRSKAQRLIDGQVLRRAFLWLGLIETLLAYSGFLLVYILFQPDRFPALAALTERIQALLPVAESLAPDAARLLAVSVFHTGVVMAQAGNAFACRTATHHGRALGWFSNPFLWGSVVVEVLIILALIYTPPLASAFDHVQIPAFLWYWLASYPFILYGLDTLRKRLAHWHPFNHRRGKRASYGGIQ